LKSDLPKILAQARACVGHAAAAFAPFPYVQQTAQKCPRSNYNAARENSQSEIGFNPDDFAGLHQDA
jgi:hypothetical protein